MTTARGDAIQRSGAFGLVAKGFLSGGLGGSGQTSPSGARALRLSSLALVALLPWAAVAHWSNPVDLRPTMAAPVDGWAPIIFPKPVEVEAAEAERWRLHPPEAPLEMTPITPIDRLAWAVENSKIERLRKQAAANALIVGSIAEWVSDGSSIRPLFAGSGMVSFAAGLSNQVDTGRLTQLRKALSDHAKARPPGWDELVARAKAEWAAGGDAALFKAVDALINDVPYVDGTDGTFFSPARLFARGGVCKDFVVAKYILMREAGFPPERMRVAVLTPRGPGGEWHVVLLALAGDSKDPLVLDLLPFPVAAQQLAKKGDTVASKVARLAKNGIDPDLVDYASAKQSLIPLSSYGTIRGIDWVGNEFGGAAFAKPMPKFDGAPALAMGAPSKAYEAGDKVWISSGEGPFSTVSIRPRSQGGKDAAKAGKGALS